MKGAEIKSPIYFRLYTTEKSFSHEEKWEKLDFLKTLLIPDFDLLESDYIYIFVHEQKKIYHG